MIVNENIDLLSRSLQFTSVDFIYKCGKIKSETLSPLNSHSDQPILLPPILLTLFITSVPRKFSISTYFLKVFVLYCSKESNQQMIRTCSRCCQNTAQQFMSRWGTQVAPVIKNTPVTAEYTRDMGSIPGLERWRRAWQPTPVFFPGESHGQGSLAGHSPIELQSQT